MSIWNIFMENFFFVHVRVFIFFLSFFASLAEIVMNNFAFNCLGSQQQRCRVAQLCGGDRGTKSDSESGSDRRCASCCGCCWVLALLWLGSVPRLRFGRIWLGSVCWQVDAPGAQTEASPHSANSTGRLEVENICERQKSFWNCIVETETRESRQ